MIKLIKKFHSIIIILIISFLTIYTISFFITSKEIFTDKIAFTVISWLIFVVAFLMMNLLNRLQSYNAMISKKHREMIFSFYVFITLFLTVLFVIRYVFDHSTNNYMFLFPINGILIATIRDISKIE